MKKTSLAASLALVLAACGGDPSLDPASPPDIVGPPPVVEPDPYVQAIPAPDLLAIGFDASVPAASARNGLSVDVATSLATPEEMLAARNAASAMDGAFDFIRRLLPEAGAPAVDVRDGVRAFGPTVRCAVDAEGDCPAGAEVESLLVVRDAGEGAFSWTIRVRALGAGDEGWLNVYFGRVAPGEVEGSRRGSFVLSLDQLRQVAWSLPGSGLVLGGYDLRPDCRALMYRSVELSAGSSSPVTGRLFVQRCEDGSLRVRFNGLRDLLPGPGGSELVTSHVGMTSAGGVGYSFIANWNPAFGYRGDVPWTEWPGEAYVLVRSCFGADRQPIHREAFTCRSDASVADCLAGEATPLAGFEGGSWAACSAVAGAVTTRAPESATLSLWDESPEAGFVAPPRPPSHPVELEQVLGI